MDLLKLQNGSDVRGVALDGVPGEAVNLTPEVAGSIAVAFAAWLSARTGKDLRDLKISLGRDPRLSGEALARGITDALLAHGVEVWDYGLASTPAMFMSTLLEGMDGAVMITASHLPFNRNGMKFFSRSGGLEKSDIRTILEQAGDRSSSSGEKGHLHHKDFLKEYAAYLIEYIRRQAADPDDPAHPLRGTRILVDAGNGSGGFFAGVLEALGADTGGSLFLDPDGHFPNHAPNPEDPQAMEALAAAVREQGADMGIIFDTDVDRAALIGHDGSSINRNALIALVSAVVLEQYPGTWIVTDSITSEGLTSFIEEHLGGHHHRFKRGYRNVINEAIRLNEEGKECHLAIETSGHAAMKENYWLDDGAYLVSFLLAKMARMRRAGEPLEALIAPLQHPVEAQELRIRILAADFAAYGQQVLDDLRDYVREEEGWSLVEPNYEGVRVSCDADHGDGWFLLRLSLHDPVLPLNAESNSSGGVRMMIEKLNQFLSRYDQLDRSKVEKYLKDERSRKTANL